MPTSFRVLSRRAVLRGIGAGLALPWLESLARAARGAAPAPLRMAFFYAPNGIVMEHWTPAQEGAGFELPYTLAPLAALQGEVLLLSGLAHDKARANGDGPGDHARAAAAFLTGVQPKKTAGADLRAGASVDQVAAQAIGHATRLRSLELGGEDGRLSGDCDSGYACAYSNTISWASAHTPVVKESSPQRLFDRVFLGGYSPERRRARLLDDATRASILDFVREDARQLRGRLGATDRRKLDEYLSAVRELERRVASFARGEDVLLPESERPEPPASHAERLRLLCDLVVAAFRLDATRVVSFMLANEGSNRSYPDLGAREGHHELSHHGGDEEKKLRIREIDRFQVAQLAYFLERLRSTEEGDSNLLDRSMIVFGSAIADGNRHTHHDLPFLVAGRGGGTLAPGRHVRYPADTPAANLYLSLLDRVGVELERFGDSTGRLAGLDG